jgi:hypothetical protein
MTLVHPPPPRSPRSKSATAGGLDGRRQPLHAAPGRFRAHRREAEDQAVDGRGDGRPILVRFTWSNITTTGARWEQEFSPDDGKTRERNWIMTMTPVR